MHLLELTRYLDLNDHPQGTELVLTHSRFAAEPIRDMHLQGWNGCIDKLGEFLALIV